MSKGKKTTYQFTINAEPQMINNVIQAYLAANNFTLRESGGATYYFHNDPILKGKRSFEYYINGNNVTILAYLGTYEKPKALEGFVAALPKQAYINEIKELMQELKKLEGNGPNPYISQTPQQGQMPPQGQIPNPNASFETFFESNNKKLETWTLIGFVIALIGLVLSCFGVTYGVLLLILEFSFAVQGLKTRKRPFAIATIVIAILSLVIIVVEVALTVLLMI